MGFDIIPALRAIEAAFPVLQNHLAEMAANIIGPAYSLQCLHSQRDFVASVQAFIPPSTVRFAPVMYEDSGPATNATSAATSSTRP